MSEATAKLAEDRASRLAAKVEAAEAKAEAQVIVSGIKARMQDDVLNADTKAEVKAMKLGANPVQATNNADMLVPLYHAYDGRRIEIPMYQVAKRLTVRFTPEEDTPAEFVGARVWHPTPQPVRDQGPRMYNCALYVGGTPSPDVLAAGLVADCKHGTEFRTQFDADEHFRKRHPKRWQALERHLNRNSGSQDKMADALKMIAQVLAGQKAMADGDSS